MPQPMVIYPSRLRLLVIVFISLVFAAVGIALIRGFTQVLLSGAPRILVLQSMLAIAAGILFIVVSGPSLAYSIPRLILRKPCIIIGDEGIEENASISAAGFVR